MFYRRIKLPFAFQGKDASQLGFDGPVHLRRSGDGRDTELRGRYRNSGAMTKVIVQSNLLSGRQPVVQRKRRPFPGGVFLDLQDRNQLLSLVSILMP